MSDRSPWSVARAEEVARAAVSSGMAPGDASGMALIRLGTNGVFRCGPAIVRVSPPDEDAELVQQQLDLARWLVNRGFPTARPLSERPTVVDALLVTAWEHLPERVGARVDRAALGRLLHRFHVLTDEYSGALPAWEPLGRLGARLSWVPTDESFTAEDRQVLCNWRDDLTSTARALRWQLAAGPIHGDVHAGNVIVGETASYLVDLDRIARGPREWDLTQPLASADRFGGPAGDVDRFMEGYGWDLRRFPGHESLALLRLLFMTSWLLTLPRTPPVQREIRVRMAFWRDPEDAPRWSPV